VLELNNNEMIVHNIEGIMYHMNAALAKLHTCDVWHRPQQYLFPPRTPSLPEHASNQNLPNEEKKAKKGIA
jgi:hypothetical protein